MLRAREFVEIDVDVNHHEEELARLQKLHAQIPHQSPEAKLQLSKEFLDIITNQNERIALRSLACVVLSGHVEDLGISGSKAARRRLYKVLDKEFMVSRRFGFFWRLKGRRFRSMAPDPMKLAFMECLLPTILRIDYDEMLETVERLIGEINDSKLSCRLEESVATVKKGRNVASQP